MGNAVAVQGTAATVIPWNANQLATMRRTAIAQDTNSDEFELFISYCMAKRLDPFVGHVIAVVYNKTAKDKSKRKLTIITTQSGSRVMAERAGGYHPAKPGDTVWTYTGYELERQRHLAEANKIFNVQERTKAIVDINENMPPLRDNPEGLLECRTVVYKHGEAAEGIAHWKEFAPLTPSPDCFDLKGTGEYWENNDGSKGNEKKRKVLKAGFNPDEHMVLDGSGRWVKAGKGMLAKCANVNALKAAYPDHFDNRFETEETVEHLRVADVTASELADIGEQERRSNAIGKAKDEYVWTDGHGEDGHYPAGEFGNVVMRTVRACKFIEEFKSLMDQRLNKESFNRYWASHKNDALTVKAEFEKFAKTLSNKPKAAAVVADDTDQEITPAPAHA